MNILHIVVPCYNEQECLNDSAKQLKEVVELLAEYGGRLIEHPYSRDTKYDEIEKLTRVKALFNK